MNPHNTFQSLKKSDSKTKLFFYILCIQLAFILLLNSSISIPQLASNYISNLIFNDENTTVEFDNLKFSVDGEILITNLRLFFPDSAMVNVRKGRIKLDLGSMIVERKNSITSVFLDEVSFFQKGRQKDFIIENLNITKVDDEKMFFQKQSSILNNTIMAKGLISTETKNNQSKINFSESIHSFLKNFEELETTFNKIEVENLKLNFSAESIAYLFIEIDSKEKNKQDFICSFRNSIVQINSNKSFKQFKISALPGKFVYSTKSQSITNGNMRMHCLYDSEKESKRISLNAGESILAGRFNGSVQPLKIDYFYTDNDSNLLLFSSNQGLKSLINLQWGNGLQHLEGFSYFKPKNISLSFLRNGLRQKLISGDSLKLDFSDNISATNGSFKTLLSLRANKFSVLEVPYGNFSCLGEMKEDFSIEVRNASGKMGNSIVNGSYSQKWNPPAYEFNVKGNCYPPDINNWLGTWWAVLWENFSFPCDVPHGDFRISGVWGGQPGNSKTYGVVDAEKLQYKGFNTLSSKILVEVDYNNTKITSSNITHKNGKLSGVLIFPRKHINSKKSLSYNLDGDYPLNDAKSIFGRSFYNVVKDINATKVLCNASGNIYNDARVTNNSNSFTVSLQSESPITVKGFKINRFYGKINQHSSRTIGDFPTFEMADGKGQLNFNLDANGSQETVNFKFSLKDAKKVLLMRDIAESQKKGYLGDFRANNQDFQSPNNLAGTLSVSLEAEGPTNNPLQFEGTGKIHLKETTVGSINLLGKVSEGLKKLNLPVPTGALSFNNLEIPFSLNNETMSFDKLNLTGPISKISAEGSLNFSSGTVDLIANLSLIGNIPVPIIKNLVQIIDPVSKIIEIKISGTFNNPKWQIMLSSN